VVETLQVAGWRPSTPGRPGGVLLADDGEWVGVGTLSLPPDQRAALVDLLERYGQRHSSVIPRDHRCRSQRRPLPPLAGSSQCSEAVPERLTAGRHRAPRRATKPTSDLMCWTPEPSIGVHLERSDRDVRCASSAPSSTI
jgi:hypothetical protein